MRSLGFDYFVKRAELLTEMARPASLFNFVSPEFNQIYAKLMKDQQAQGIADNGTRQLVVWRFLIDTINEFGEVYHNEEGELATSLEIAKQLVGGNRTNHGALSKAVQKVLQDNIQIARNPKFTEFISQPENIERFKSYIGFSPDSKSTSSRRMGKENELVDVTGKGITEYEQSTSKVRDLVLTMNKIMGIRKKKKIDQTGQVTTTQENPSIDFDPNIDFAYGIVNAIETVLDSRNEYLQEVQSGEIELDELPREVQNLVNSKSAEADLNYIKGMYEKMITDKTGTTQEEFQNFINKLKGIKGMTPERAAIFDILLNEISDLESHELLDIPTSETQYQGYDADVVAKVLDTPEKKEAFDGWFRTHTQWRKAKNEKLEQLLMNKLIDVQIKLNPKLQGANNNDMHINPAIQQLMVNIQGYEKLLDKTTDPKKEEQILNKIQQIQAKIAEIRGNKNQPEIPEEQEEDIMDTFVESLQSKYYKPKGQFVDRGFKRFTNYAHWLMNND